MMIGILFAAGKRVMLNEDGMYMVLSFYKWPGGGTGRPAALKMLFPNGSVGSSPTRATKCFVKGDRHMGSNETCGAGVRNDTDDFTSKIGMWDWICPSSKKNGSYTYFILNGAFV